MSEDSQVTPFGQTPAYDPSDGAAGRQAATASAAADAAAHAAAVEAGRAARVASGWPTARLFWTVAGAVALGMIAAGLVGWIVWAVVDASSY